MSSLDVHCEPTPAGWRCAVRVREGGSATDHVVRVTTADLVDLASGATDPTELVRASFVFLLEHEPKESILGSFDLLVIGRYFPGYRSTIRDRMMRGDV